VGEDRGSKETDRCPLTVTPLFIKTRSSYHLVDNLCTTQTPECSKGKYNAKIKKGKVSPKVSPTTYVDRRLEERKMRRG
jgi:hypothetical protein